MDLRNELVEFGQKRITDVLASLTDEQRTVVDIVRQADRLVAIGIPEQEAIATALLREAGFQKPEPEPAPVSIMQAVNDALALNTPDVSDEVERLARFGRIGSKVRFRAKDVDPKKISGRCNYYGGAGWYTVRRKRGWVTVTKTHNAHLRRATPRKAA